MPHATQRRRAGESHQNQSIQLFWRVPLGADHPNVATSLNNLALLLQATNRLAEAEPLMRQHVAVFVEFTRRTGHPHPHLEAAFRNYAGLLKAMGKSSAEIEAALAELKQPLRRP